MFVGIDYSLSSPGICVSTTKECNLDDCTFFYLTSKKKYEGVFDNIHGELHQKWTTPEERYHHISDWVLRCVPKDAELITIEDYAMGAKGRVFHIGENAGIMKYRLWLQQQKYQTLSPSEIKKFATGKGNANKEKMYEAFMSEHKYNIKELLAQDTLDSPVTDIIDAYYICKAGINALR
jgi:Holliday junction resolvasome RuvABC endonuclease subunit